MAKKPKIEPQKSIPSVRELACRLTDDERKTRTEELLDCEDKLEALDEEKKQAVAGIKARTSEVKKRVKELRSTLRSGDEVRQVGCTTTPDFDLHKMVTTRDDSGLVLESRPMTEHERQGKLFPEDEREPGKLIPIKGGKFGEPSDPVDEAVKLAEGHLADAQAPTAASGDFPKDGEDAPAADEKPAKKKTSRARRADAVMQPDGGA